MGTIFYVIVVIWIGWIVLVVVYQTLSGILKVLGELLGSLSTAARAKDEPRAETSFLGHLRDGGRTRDDAKPKSKASSSSVGDKVLSPLELSIGQVEWHGSGSHLEIKIRGGEPDPADGSIIYVISAARIGSKTAFIGESSSTKEIPAPFCRRYELKAPKPSYGGWCFLAVISIDELLPPRGGVFLYDFKCVAFRRSGTSNAFLSSAHGHFIEKAESSVSLNLPAPGYVDEIESFHLRQQCVRLMADLFRSCVINVDKKRDALVSWVDSIKLSTRHERRREEFKVGLRQILSDLNRPSVVDLGVLCAVRDARDYELMASMACLVLELAGKEPGGSDIRMAYSAMRDQFDVNLKDGHIKTIWPEPPLSVDRPPTPKAPSLELRLEPIEEAGCAKGVEVHVRGFAGPGLSTQLEFWLWDETSGDTPFLKSAADIDRVHQRAIHEVSWKSGEYNPMIWQPAGIIKFNDVLPPAAGLRRISVGGRIVGTFALSSKEASVRSAPSVMNVSSRGYEAIRDARQRLRLRAFVLTVGIALLSGKGPTYSQDKALKGFAKLLCAEISDRKWADACLAGMEALIDAHVEHTLHGLTRQLHVLKDEACPHLKSQLLDAITEVMASRRVRSKESRDFHEYCRKALA